MMIQNRMLLEKMIMEERHHQFIYGYDGVRREQLLRDLLTSFPIKLDSSEPMGVYLGSNGLPKIDTNNEGLRADSLNALSREYRNFSIATSILDTAIDQIGIKDLDDRSGEFINKIIRLSRDDDNVPIGTLKELRDIISEGKDIYRQEYEKYIKSGQLDYRFLVTPISLINLEMFIRAFKKMINNESYVALIVDHQDPIALRSQQAINDLIASRINKYLSIKVASKPEGWETYYNSNGSFVEYIHDYGIVEVDNSYPAYIKRLKRDYH